MLHYVSKKDGRIWVGMDIDANSIEQIPGMISRLTGETCRISTTYDDEFEIATSKGRLLEFKTGSVMMFDAGRDAYRGEYFFVDPYQLKDYEVMQQTPQANITQIPSITLYLESGGDPVTFNYVSDFVDYSTEYVFNVTDPDSGFKHEVTVPRKQVSILMKGGDVHGKGSQTEKEA